MGLDRLLENARSQLKSSQKAMEQAIAAMESVQAEVNRLEETILTLQARQRELEQWLQLKGNEEVLQQYLEDQFRRNSQEQTMWGVIGLVGGAMLGLIMPALLRLLRKR
jgi:hypothetical protein